MKQKPAFFSQSLPRQPIERLVGPLQDFMHKEAAGGIVLLICTFVALIWANSQWGEIYQALWQTRVTIGGEIVGLSKDLLHWINDGLMAVFFFVVGLEIKRELLVGELSRPRQAALPIAAAIGGMVGPALLYVVLNPGEPGLRGWGVPMATDIAFSLGVLALLGSSVPTSAKIFLTAFAIVDDLGASLVIALFYTEQIGVGYLVAGAIFMAIMVILNRTGVRKPIPFAIFGFLLWVAFLKSGVHPTIAGVLGALTIPSSTRVDAASFVRRGKRFLEEFEQSGLADKPGLASQEQQNALRALEGACELAQTPLQRLEHGLHPWVAFFVMPVFALANTGVALGGAGLAEQINSVSIGVVLGLVVGKQIGITAFAWFAVRLGLAERPADLSWLKIYGLAWLGGIGFTMSLFIAGLAFSDPGTLDSAKIGILAGSLISGVGGWLILRSALGRTGAPS